MKQKQIKKYTSEEKKLFEQFVKGIESLPKVPFDEPYDVSDYDKKNQKVLQEIDQNRNHPWIKEVWNVNRTTHLDKPAIKYRGHIFTYRDFFIQSYRYAKALKANGVKKGQEFVCCIENVPEFPFLMGAASIIGAKVNLVSADMDKEYLKEIIANADAPYIFVSDKNFVEFAPTLTEVDSNKKVIILPLEYSLHGDNLYRELTEKYYKLDQVAFEQAKQEISNLVDIDEFLNSGKSFDDAKVFESTGLNDEFTITYTSGSTSSNRPKGLVHCNRSYITMGRYHDPKLSGIPSMKDRTMLAFVRTMSDTDFMSAVSDLFLQSGTTAMEPINDSKFVLDSIAMNKPSVAITSRSVWLDVMKRQRSEPRYKNLTFDDLIAPMCIGEPLDAGEEKQLNRWLRSMKSGVALTKVPIACMSLAGGDSEHGGIFLVMYRAYQAPKMKLFGIHEPAGMGTYGMVQVKALRPDGTHCDLMEPGQLVANSPCTMEGYRNNPKAEKEFWITDANGKKWANLNTFGYIDRFNNIYVKGRMNLSKGDIPNYQIAESILKDTKKIMSCEVVNSEVDGEPVYVAHIEPQIDTSFDEDKVLTGAALRCRSNFNEDLLDRLYFRIHSNEESFELTPTLKRSFKALTDEGVSEKCKLASDYLPKEKTSQSTRGKTLILKP